MVPSTELVGGAAPVCIVKAHVQRSRAGVSGITFQGTFTKTLRYDTNNCTKHVGRVAVALAVMGDEE